MIKDFLLVISTIINSKRSGPKIDNLNQQICSRVKTFYFLGELYRAVPSGEEYDTTSMTIADENSLRRPLELPDEVAKSQTAALEVLERALLRIEDPKCQ